MLQLAEWRSPQRVCVLCVTDFERVPPVTHRLAQLGNMLRVAVNPLAPASQPSTLNEAAELCEAALAPVEELKKAHQLERARAERLEAELKREQEAKLQLEVKAVAAREFILRFGDRLHVLLAACGDGSSPRAAPQLGSLEDAMEFCEGALPLLQTAMDRLESLEMRRPRSAEAQAQTDARGAEDDASVHALGLIPASESQLSVGGDGAHECAVCGAKVGKRHLNPRHSCKVCGRTVCGSCSPNSVQLSGHGCGRACVPCIAEIARAPALRGRLVDFGERLYRIANAERKLGVYENLEEAVVFCEQALGPLEEMHRKHSEVKVLADQVRAQLEARAQDAKETSTELSRRLADLATPTSRSPAPSASEPEAVAAAAPAEPVEEAKAKPKAKAGKERKLEDPNSLAFWS